jgi:hypothetical protein
MPEANRRYSYADISNGALILSLLSDCENFPALCDHFEGAYPNDPVSTAAMDLRRKLRELHKAGLVQFDGKKLDDLNAVVALKQTPLWSKIAVALGGMSLSEVVRLSRHGKGMAVEPVFKRPELPPRKERADVFVLMPFKADHGKIYWEHIKNLGTDLKIRIERSDEHFEPGQFFQRVWNSICAARLILAICSESNPNVFYEIGIAHTVGKKVVLLTHAEFQMPSDMGHLELINYSNDPERMQAMLDKLRGYDRRAARDSLFAPVRCPLREVPAAPPGSPACPPAAPDCRFR